MALAFRMAMRVNFRMSKSTILAWEQGQVAARDPSGPQCPHLWGRGRNLLL